MFFSIFTSKTLSKRAVLFVLYCPVLRMTREKAELEYSGLYSGAFNAVFT